MIKIKSRNRKAVVLCGIMLLSLVFSITSFAADANLSFTAPNNGSSYTFSVPLQVNETEPYAGIQFKLALSNAENLSYTFTMGSAVTSKGAKKYAPTADTNFFGFWCDDNVFSGNLLVGTLSFTYTGHEPQAITITEMTIVRVDIVTNTSNGTVMPLPIDTINVSRAGSETIYAGNPGQTVNKSINPSDTNGELVGDGDTPLAGMHYFDDVDETHYAWALEAVDALAAAGVINGTAPRIYSPAQNIKRGDFMLMLARAYNLQGSFDGNFSDVPNESYYYDAIGIAKNLGIAQGVSSNEFNPEAPITRQDMMTLVDRTLQAIEKPLPVGSSADLSVFSDKGKVSGYAIDAVATLVKSGIIQGNGPGQLNPLGLATRAEMAVVMYRLLALG